MIAQELEVSLHLAFVEARQKRHEFITVEHLLLVLLDNPSAAEVLRACGADIEGLRKDISSFIATIPRQLPVPRKSIPNPHWDFSELFSGQFFTYSRLERRR